MNQSQTARYQQKKGIILSVIISLLHIDVKNIKYQKCWYVYGRPSGTMQCTREKSLYVSKSLGTPE